MNSQPVLRFVVMLPSMKVKTWQADCIRTLLDGGLAQPVLIITDGSITTGKLATAKLRKYTGPNALFHLYEKYRLKIPALHMDDVTADLAGIESISCRAVRKGRYSDYMPEDVLERLRVLKPDFILRFAFNILKGEVLQIPRYGVWSFHHADEQVFRGGPAAFWEVFRGHHRIGVILQRLSEKIDAGAVLKKGWFRVSRHSYPETLNRVLEGAVFWPADVCRRIYDGRLEITEPPQNPLLPPMNRLPRNHQMLRFALVSVARRIAFYIERYLMVEEWNIGVVDGSLENVIHNGIVKEPRWLLKTGRARFAADPCVLTDSLGEDWILFEDYRHRRGRGEIHALNLRDSAEFCLIKTDGHLAFPRLVRLQGKTLMTVEASLTGDTMAFPLGDSVSQLDSPVLVYPGMPVIDPVLHFHDGLWYLFGTLRSSDTNTTLHLWFSHSIQGPWTAHPHDPVVTDISSARMAGPIIRTDAGLFRPAQDSAERYGRQMAVRRITRLSPEQYAEEPYRVISPSPEWKYSSGLHTLDGNGRFTVIDAKRYRCSLWPLLRKISGRQTADSRRRTTDDGRQTTDVRRQTTDGGRQTTDAIQRTDDD